MLFTISKVLLISINKINYYNSDKIIDKWWIIF